MSDRPGTGLSFPGRFLFGSLLIFSMVLMTEACLTPETQTESGEFSFLYLDASEAENRRNLQKLLNKIGGKEQTAKNPWLIYFSNTKEPFIGSDKASFAKIRQATVLQAPPIPKPLEEADRVWEQLQQISPQWEGKSIKLSFFLSRSFHDISKNRSLIA